MAPTAALDDPYPVVGREREREQLLHVFDSAISGSGRLVLVSGQAGIGKTTLIEHVAHDATERDMLVMNGGCYDLTTTPPYGPWMEVLRRYPADSSPIKPPEELRARESVAQIASQEQFFRIVGSFFGDVAVATPLVLILEDLHWSDIESIELLRFLARQCTQQRIVLIASYRDDELARGDPLFTALPLLVRESRAERLEVQPFDADAMRAFVRDRFPLSSDDIQALASYLLQHTEGNPLFAAELLRSIARDGALQKLGGGWNLGNLDTVAPPPLLVQMIERQLTTLDPSTRGALEIAALIGQEITLGLWQKIAGIDDERLSVIVEEGLLTRVIEQRGGMQPRIRHALIRDVLYHSIRFPQRRLLHRQVAEALVEAQSPEADLIAHHFQQAGDERAVEWLIRAGDNADHAEAHFTAIERYEAALRLLGDNEAKRRERGWLLVALGQSGRDIIAHRALEYTKEARRIGQEIGDAALAAWALYFLGENRVLVGQNGLSEMEQGLAAVRRLPQVDLPKLPSRFRRSYMRDVHSNDMDSNVIIIQALFGRYQEALANAEEFLTRDPPTDAFTWGLRGHAEAARACALHALGDPESATVSYRLTRDAYQRANWSWHGALNSTTDLHYGTLCYNADQIVDRQHRAAEVESVWTQASGMTIQLPPRVGLLPLLVIEGAWTEARELTLPFVTRDMPFYYDFARYALGTIARWQGEPHIAWEQVHAALPDGHQTEPGSVWMLFTIELQRLAADLALDAGDLELAYRWIGAHDHWIEWSERIQGRSEAQLLWARYHRIAGDPETAHHHAGQALEYAANPRQPLALIAAYRLLGEIDTDSGQHAEAEEYLRHALNWAEACAAPYEQVLTLLVLAELYTVTNKPDDAWKHLDQARTICTPLDAKPSFQRARTIAARLAVRRGQPSHPAGLTPREVEVLRLVAEGLTDADVAERLFLSPRTVSTHLTSVYNKLGVNSRVGATRFAVEHGLTGPPTQ